MSDLATTQTLLRRLQDALVESTIPSRTTFNAGGFVIMLTPHDPLIWLNYAVPIGPLTPSSVEEMVSIFRAEKRAPRLEFFVELWPELPASLDANGFTCEKRMPIMVMEPAEWHGFVNMHDVHELGPLEVDRLNPVLAEAYGMPPPSETDAGDVTMKESLACGRALGAMALIDGKVAGGGYAIGTRAVREVAGIGTREAYRRRGVASAVIANLLDRLFKDGGEVAWLTPGDDSAQFVYARLGFRPIGEQVCYQLTP